VHRTGTSACKTGASPTFATSHLFFLSTVFFLTAFSDAPVTDRQTDSPAQKPSSTGGGFCTLTANIRNSVTLFEGPQASTACPSDKAGMKTKMNLVRWCNDTERKTEESGENPCYGVTVCTRGIRWPDWRIQPNYPMSDIPLAMVQHEEKKAARGALQDTTISAVSAGRT